MAWVRTKGTYSQDTYPSRSGQHNIGRQSDGTLWTSDYTGLFYSKDNGATWTKAASTALNPCPSLSFFIDKNDNLHAFVGATVDYSSASASSTYLVGKPNAGKTDFTFSSAVVVQSGYAGKGDLVAFPHPTNPNLVVAAVHYFVSGSAYRIMLFQSDVSGATPTTPVALSSMTSYIDVGSGGSDYPFSIDFQHTGDGKTPAQNWPNLYTVSSYSAGVVGTQYRVSTADANGKYTAGTQTTLSANVSNGSVTCVYDGSKLHVVWNNTTDGTKHAECPTAGGAPTATRTVGTKAAFGDFLSLGQTSSELYLAASPSGNSISLARFTKSTGVWDAPTVLTTNNPAGDGKTLALNPSSAFTIRHNDAGSRIHVAAVFADQATTTNQVTMVWAQTTNVPPTAAITAPANNAQVDPRAAFTVSWTYTDTEGAAQQQWKVQTSTDNATWADLASGSGAASSYAVPKNTFPDETTRYIRVGVYDGKDWGYSTGVTLRVDSWTYVAEETTASTTGYISTDPLQVAEYEVEVRTADAVGYGPWSSPYLVQGEQTLVWNGTRWVPSGTWEGYDAAWAANRPAVWDGSDWKPMRVR